MRKGSVARVCLECGASFRTWPYKIAQGNGIYCSMSCASRQPRVRVTPDSKYRDRLDSRSVQVEAPSYAMLDSPCLLWTGSLSRDGYGLLWFRGVNQRTHRVAWILAHGAVPLGLQVLHRCDRRPCIEVSHLWLGINNDNMSDRDSKERLARGERQGNATLTKEDVLEIRSLRGIETGVALGRRFGVSHTTISMVQLRRSWRHIA